MKRKNYSENLEHSINKLKPYIHEKIDNAAKEKLDHTYNEKEIVKQSIKTYSQQVKSTTENAKQNLEQFYPEYIIHNETDPNIKKIIDNLLQLVLEGDLENAVNIAKKYPPFVEDAFHDAMVEKMIPILKQKKII
ncbi:MAG: hypothetical protein ACP5IC_00265 [Minisyncoccia bacterium]